MVWLLAAILLGMHPDPVEMPRADAYLVTEGARRYLEDRYNRLDLWQSHVIDGCWYDDDGRYFIAATMRETPPATGIGDLLTREEYAKGAAEPDRDNDRELRVALERLAGEPVDGDFTGPRQLPRGLRELRYYSTTNDRELVAAFLPERERRWRAAIWTLAEGDGREDIVGRFEDEYLAEREYPPAADGGERSRGRRRAKASERELLRADARHSVAAYPEWRVTDSEEFTVLDDLIASDGFIAEVTNELGVARARFAATVPSPLDASNTLAVARIFANRREYAEVCGEDMQWTAAYWDPERRELVAYLPPEGGEKLIGTLRHEAFHQYLSYATSMITASPWFNEGYAQYFEETDPARVELPGTAEANAANLRTVMAMDYDEFYGGTAEERHYKYQLAKSIAVFLELGAPEVFKEPFKDVKRDYIRALLETKNASVATAAAFGSQDKFDRFVVEWTKFQEQ